VGLQIPDSCGADFKSTPAGLQIRTSRISIDAIVHMEGEVPKDIVIEDKTTSEQMRLIQELDEKDKSIVFSMIDIMLTKKKFKDFFQKNVAAL